LIAAPVAGVPLVVEPVPVLAGVLVAAVVVAGVLAAGVLVVDFDFELLDPHAASSSAVAAMGTIALSRGRYWFNVASPLWLCAASGVSAALHQPPPADGHRSLEQTPPTRTVASVEQRRSGANER
jgi:hypothetical protein